MPIIIPKQLAQEELMKLENSKPIPLTPEQKFARLQQRNKGTRNQIRKFHFSAIVTGKSVKVFNGDGEEIGNYEFTVESIRLARIDCLARFSQAKKWETQGGYKFDIVGGNLEILSDEEFEKMVKTVHNWLEFENMEETNEANFNLARKLR